MYKKNEITNKNTRTIMEENDMNTNTKSILDWVYETNPYRQIAKRELMHNGIIIIDDEPTVAERRFILEFVAGLTDEILTAIGATRRVNKGRERAMKNYDGFISRKSPLFNSVFPEHVAMYSNWSEDENYWRRVAKRHLTGKNEYCDEIEVKLYCEVLEFIAGLTDEQFEIIDEIKLKDACCEWENDKNVLRRTIKAVLADGNAEECLKLTDEDMKKLKSFAMLDDGVFDYIADNCDIILF